MKAVLVPNLGLERILPPAQLKPSTNFRVLTINHPVLATWTLPLHGDYSGRLSINCTSNKLRLMAHLTTILFYFYSLILYNHVLYIAFDYLARFGVPI